MIAPAEVSAGTETDEVEAKPKAKTEKKKPLPWAGTSLGWDHSATTETVGIGRDTQTLNPTYEWTLMLNPRYKVFSDDDQSVSVLAGLGISREFTNSDITTDRGEWTLTDWTLAAVYNRTLLKDGDYKTGLSVTLPNLSFPTSVFSQANGKIMGVQGAVNVSQTVPVLGGSAKALKSFSVSGGAGYGHAFTEATTQTGDDLERNRTGLDAEPTISDQLTGVTNSKHQVIAGFGGSLAILDELNLSTNFQWRPNWKYLPSEGCVTVQNVDGCFTPGHISEPQNFAVITMFVADVSYQPIDELSVSAGYMNIANQVAPDGERRNMFYSPNARFYLTITGYLDAIYEDIVGDSSDGHDDVAAVSAATVIE